jgi:hypothetical protein
MKLFVLPAEAHTAQTRAEASDSTFEKYLLAIH